MTEFRTALVMAGGRSERMRADGAGTHKALRRVGARTLLQWNVDALRYHGFADIFVAVNAGEQEVRDAVQADAALKLIAEQTPLGTIGAVRELPDNVTDVVVVNVDNLTDLDLVRFADYHRQRGAAATIACHDEPFRIPFGRLRIADSLVTAYEEKPVLPVTVSSGTYVLNRRAIDLVGKGVRTDVPALIDELLRRGEVVCAYPHQARWIDVNDRRALADASEITTSAGNRWPGWAGGRGRAAGD